MNKQHLLKRNRKSLEIFKRDNYKCFYCGIECAMSFHGKKRITVDHKIPKSKGGGNHMDNLVTCCHECNSKKADKSVDNST